MTTQQFTILMQKWKEGQISQAETVDLITAIQSGQFDELTGDIVEGHMDAGDLNELIDSGDKQVVFQRLMEIRSSRYGKTTHRIHFIKTAWFRVAVVVLFFSGIGAYLWFQPSINKSVFTQNKPDTAKKDIIPGGNKALLKLADGSTIILDNVSNGLLAKQAGSEIKKSADGQIVYSFNKLSGAADITYNTMTTPKGGQYQLVLADGTNVWLNAASSISFPTSFTGKERRVKVEGELYFEIHPNPNQPFFIEVNGTELQVMGTSFNVHAYADEADIFTTLMEGSIKVSRNKSSKILIPGQQARTNSSGNTDNTIDVTDVDNPDMFIAWKNGYFNFDGSNIDNLAREIGRWYNVDVIIEGSHNGNDIKRYSGKMERNLSMIQVISLMQKLGVDCEIKGNTLLVKR